MPFSNAETVPALMQGAWFAGLPADLRDDMLEALTIRSVPARTSLYAQGEAATGLHGVVSGAFRLIGMAPDGGEVIMGMARGGDWMGFMSAADERPHAFSAVASVDSKVATLNPAAVRRIFDKSVERYRQLVLPELAATRKVYRYLVEDVAKPVEQRVASRLYDLGRWAYAEDDDARATFDNLSQDAFAMSVAASRQSVNAVLKAFEARGLVKLGYGRITVLDAAAIRRVAARD